MTKIFFSNPLAAYKKNHSVFDKVSKKIFTSGNYLLGNQNKIFEKKLSSYLNCKYSLNVKNGTDALFIAIKSLNLNKNAEVIMPSLTATATASAVVQAGHKISFCDVDHNLHTSNLINIKNKINKNTKLIILVHLHGQAADVEKISKFCKSKKIYLIEDCAQSLGSSYKRKKIGTFGDISTHSFFPTKNLAAFGDGGAVCTDNFKLFSKMKLISQYGWNKNRISIVDGINSRLDEFQAGILNVKIDYLDADLKARNAVAEYYFKNINNKKILPTIRDDAYHSFHLFVIKSKQRDEIINKLKQKKIFAGIHYKYPLHKMKAFSNYKASLPVTEKLSKIFVSLPIYPEIKLSVLKKICTIVNSVEK
jgi:dTDP-4-amino-4,6-dideoxygalactose transaminase